MTKNNMNQTDVNHVKKQNQKSAQSPYTMNEEFGVETDVNHVKQQNQQAEANKMNASGQRANQYNKGSK